MKKNIYIITILLVTVSIFGCTTIPVFRDRLSLADSIASKAGFTKEYVKAGGFTLMTYQRFSKLSDSISIYIEGDGRAWETKHRLSEDPTPSNPVALTLTTVDPAKNVAYIARPGQYSLSGFPECNSKYWSSRRFAPEVVESINKAIDILKEKSGAKYVELIGYSGGGAIAILVAARRSDVVALRTVAGNLDPRALSEYHHVSQLDGSMNPPDVAQKVAHIPQRHFVGSKDKVIPFAIVESFVKMEGDNGCQRITIVDGASHNDGWYKRWKELLLMPLATYSEKR
ncbi:MAG: alpha/beta hydrolase [Candidatus Omnitrophica bacterium]|nr:alpha/beta hydrolase [Candidatus Omnitrophota bacterium]